MMADIAFPAWFGPKGGDPIQVKNALEIQEGWVQHFGHYDAQRGCWVARAVPPASPDELRALLAAEAAPAEPKAEQPAKAPSALGDLRRQYKAKFGKNPSPRLKADALREKLA